jgi:hypothetical protein
LNIETEVKRLERMTVGALADKYLALLGEETRSRNKKYLVRRIAWHLQAKHEGGLSERAQNRAEELADEAVLRVRAPSAFLASDPETPGHFQRPKPGRDPRLPMPGAIITKEYRGQLIEVLVRTDGFEWSGRFFRSLSAAAKAISGSHVNGFAFFGL